jgi:hypothetical protein
VAKAFSEGGLVGRGQNNLWWETALEIEWATSCPTAWRCGKELGILPHYYYYYFPWKDLWKVLDRIWENKTLVNNFLRRKANWICHIPIRNCLLHDAIEGQMTEVKGVERRRKKLLENLRNRIFPMPFMCNLNTPTWGGKRVTCDISLCLSEGRGDLVFSH